MRAAGVSKSLTHSVGAGQFALGNLDSDSASSTSRLELLSLDDAEIYSGLPLKRITGQSEIEVVAKPLIARIAYEAQ